MADNTPVTNGTGDVIRDIDHGGVKTQVVGIDINPAGAEHLMAAGQQTMANSVPVALASDQSAVPITDTGYLTEDAAAAGNPIGPIMNVRRRDTLTAAEVTTDGDVITLNATAKGEVYVKQTDSVPVTDNGGNLSIDDGGNSITVDNGGTFAVQDSEKVADNAGFTDGTTKVMPSGYIFDETAGTALTENDAAAARIDSKRAQVLVIEDETTRGRRVTVTAANALKVDGSAVNQPANIQIAGTAVDGNSGTKSAGTIRVVLATDQPNLTTPLNHQGDIAHDGVDSGNPVKVGMRAIAHGTNPTAVSAADRTDWLANRAGVPFVIGGHPNPVMYGMSITTAATNAIIGPTIGAGLKLVVTAITVVLDNASTVFPSVVIGFGTSTTPAFATTPGTSKVIAGHPAVPAGGGFNRGDGSGIVGVGADDEELRITTVGTAGGNGLYVLLTGFTVES